MKYSKAATDGGDNAPHDPVSQQIIALQEKIKKFKASGIIFWREDLDDNIPLKLRFVSLQSGKVDIFRNLEDFDNGADALNSRPIDLKDYDVETDYNKFPVGNITVGSLLNKAISGQKDFSLIDIARSEYDLVEAHKRFRFFIIPRVMNETRPLKMVEFMATDEEAYKKWIATFRRSCR